MGFGEAVIDVLAEGVQRDAAFALPLAAGDFGPAETAGTLDPDPLGAERHGHFNGLFHGAAESNAALELKGDILRHQLRFDLGLLHLLDVEEDFLAGELGEFVLDLLDLLAFAPDDDARAGGEDLYADPVGGSLDEDTRNRGLLELLHELGTDDLVFEEQTGKILLVRKPARLPVVVDGEAKTDGMCLLTHGERGWPRRAGLGGG